MPYHESLADTWQASIMGELFQILDETDQLEEFDFTWHEIGQLSTQVFELNMLAYAVEFAFPLRPASGAVLCRVLELALRYH